MKVCVKKRVLSLQVCRVNEKKAENYILINIEAWFAYHARLAFSYHIPLTTIIKSVPFAG